MSKPRIAFVTGGYSSEAVISYKSAITIENNLDLEKFEVYRIDITPEKWFHPSKEGGEIPVDISDFSISSDGVKITFEAVLIGIHGTPGEDGKLQGYFDLMDLPYTSCDAATSALTFNKRFTVAVAAFSGINVARSLHLFRHTPVAPENILKQLAPWHYATLGKNVLSLNHIFFIIMFTNSTNNINQKYKMEKKCSSN